MGLERSQIALGRADRLVPALAGEQVRTRPPSRLEDAWTVRVGDGGQMDGGRSEMDERGKGIRKGIAAAACLL